MNVSNWWGVLYGAAGVLAVFAAGIVLVAFGWMRHAEMGAGHVQTDVEGEGIGEPDVDEGRIAADVEQLLRDISERRDTA